MKKKIAQKIALFFSRLDKTGKTIYEAIAGTQSQ